MTDRLVLSETPELPQESRDVSETKQQLDRTTIEPAAQLEKVRDVKQSEDLEKEVVAAVEAASKIEAAPAITLEGAGVAGVVTITAAEAVAGGRPETGDREAIIDSNEGASTVGIIDSNDGSAHPSVADLPEPVDPRQPLSPENSGSFMAEDHSEESSQQSEADLGTDSQVYAQPSRSGESIGFTGNIVHRDFSGNEVRGEDYDDEAAKAAEAQKELDMLIQEYHSESSHRPGGEEALEAAKREVENITHQQNDELSSKPLEDTGTDRQAVTHSGDSILNGGELPESQGDDPSEESTIQEGLELPSDLVGSIVGDIPNPDLVTSTMIEEGDPEADAIGQESQDDVDEFQNELDELMNKKDDLMKMIAILDQEREKFQSMYGSSPNSLWVSVDLSWPTVIENADGTYEFGVDGGKVVPGPDMVEQYQELVQEGVASMIEGNNILHSALAEIEHSISAHLESNTQED